ncbi:hypothetical protein DPEC_G00088460 [Dallia pectoralis]|uniref:Uncharacterized protein n=1 Tax=Dallia pectoralis TaxID=75939 RepID=A0ACC2H0P4_DALPE|nr:hypothetical protein DPEC_G00088460 [Dallia pectoralis]
MPQPVPPPLSNKREISARTNPPLSDDSLTSNGTHNAASNQAVGAPLETVRQSDLTRGHHTPFILSAPLYRRSRGDGARQRSFVAIKHGQARKKHLCVSEDPGIGPGVTKRGVISVYPRFLCSGLCYTGGCIQLLPADGGHLPGGTYP